MWPQGFTFGNATIPDKPNQENGNKLHAASRSAHVQAQSGAVKRTADKAVDVTSTNVMVNITPPMQIFLAAAGASLDIQSVSITISAPGMVQCNAGMKTLDGAGSANQSLNLMKPANLKGCIQNAQKVATVAAATVDVG
jgi:type VI secretion system secreted protein VgrG